jgi:hypothetical protein
MRVKQKIFFCTVNKRVFSGVLHEGTAARGRLAAVLLETSALWQFGYALKRCLMFSGCKSRPAGVVPAGSNWRGGGGDEAA